MRRLAVSLRHQAAPAANDSLLSSLRLAWLNSYYILILFSSFYKTTEPFFHNFSRQHHLSVTSDTSQTKIHTYTKDFPFIGPTRMLLLHFYYITNLELFFHNYHHPKLYTNIKRMPETQKRIPDIVMRITRLELA